MSLVYMLFWGQKYRFPFQRMQIHICARRAGDTDGEMCHGTAKGYCVLLVRDK